MAVDVGVSKGDLCSWAVVVDEGREVCMRGSFRTSRTELSSQLSQFSGARVILEAGSQSPWMSRELCSEGFDVLVVDPRRVQLISRDPRKTDRRDAEMLARLGAACPELLGRIRHRGAQAQADLGILRARDLLVRVRTKAVQQVRGLSKAFGIRLQAASTSAFPRRIRDHLPAELHPAVDPIFETIEQLTVRIRAYERTLAGIAGERYPEVGVLQQVNGVGPVTATAFVLTIEEPGRFANSRRVGSWLGLCPRSQASGDRDPELPISRAGDGYVRRLLLQCAHYILGPFGKDSDLRRFGKRILARGGRSARKRAAVAVARKLAVLMHRLWITGELYEPLRNTTKAASKPAA